MQSGVGGFTDSPGDFPVVLKTSEHALRSPGGRVEPQLVGAPSPASMSEILNLLDNLQAFQLP